MGEEGSIGGAGTRMLRRSVWRRFAGLLNRFTRRKARSGSTSPNEGGDKVSIETNTQTQHSTREASIPRESFMQQGGVISHLTNDRATHPETHPLRPHTHIGLETLIRDMMHRAEATTPLSSNVPYYQPSASTTSRNSTPLNHTSYDCGNTEFVRRVLRRWEDEDQVVSVDEMYCRQLVAIHVTKVWEAWMF
jgi:hypothetical protein